VTGSRRRSLVAVCHALALATCPSPGHALEGPFDTCQDAVQTESTEPSSELNLVSAVMEPRGTLHQLVHEADDLLKRCPNNERLWYELVRGDEMLLEYSLASGQPFMTSLAKLTAEAVRRIPDSPRIALVDARARPEPEHVAALVARFPEFAPLRVALARAQLDSGDVDAAAATMAALKNVKSVSGAVETLAAIRLAKGDPAGALKTLANRAVRDSVGSEADWWTGRLRRQRAEVAYQAQLALHRPAAALRPLLDAAERGSKAAQELLKKPDPPVAKAIAAARRSGKLNAIDREYLKK
jgi:hypothetical protein